MISSRAHEGALCMMWNASATGPDSWQGHSLGETLHAEATYTQIHQCHNTNPCAWRIVKHAYGGSTGITPHQCKPPTVCCVYRCSPSLLHRRQENLYRNVPNATCSVTQPVKAGCQKYTARAPSLPLHAPSHPYRPRLSRPPTLSTAAGMIKRLAESVSRRRLSGHIKCHNASDAGIFH